MAEVLAKRITWEGRTYDSQLEADWAATLESWGMRVAHHPGNYRFREADGWWEPDFLVQDWTGEETLVEVKGPGGDRLWKPRQAEIETGKGVVVLRPGLVFPGSDVESAGAVWHGVELWGGEWVVEFAAGGVRFTRTPEGGDVRVSAERCVVRPEATGLGMRKALGREVRA